jgi:hypothetical protein
VYLVVGAPRFVVAASTRMPLPLAMIMAAEGLAGGVINPLVATVVAGIVPEPLGTLAAGWLAGSAGLSAALTGRWRPVTPGHNVPAAIPGVAAVAALSRRRSRGPGAR